MLQPVHLGGPGQVAPEEVLDPGILGTGEHGEAIVVSASTTAASARAARQLGGA